MSCLSVSVILCLQCCSAHSVSAPSLRVLQVWLKGFLWLTHPQSSSAGCTQISRNEAVLCVLAGRSAPKMTIPQMAEALRKHTFNTHNKVETHSKSEIHFTGKPQQRECTWHYWTIHWKMINMVNFTERKPNYPPLMDALLHVKFSPPEVDNEVMKTVEVGCWQLS
jgi:hypothetical protein